MRMAMARGAAPLYAPTMVADVLYDYMRSSAWQEGNQTTPAAANDPIGYLEDRACRAPGSQDNTGRRPAMTAAGWDFDGSDDHLFGFEQDVLTAASSFTVPDLSDSIAGKGFTCTGITLDTSDNTLWIANDGRSNAADSSHRAGLVNVTKAGVKVVERDLSGTFGSMTTIQGVVYDATDDSLWFCSTAENLVRHVSAADGSNIGSFSSTSCNGIALDTVNGHLIVVSTSGTLTTYNKSGTQQATFTFEVCDCIYFDSAAGILYYAMEPANGVNYIGLFHLATRQYLGKWALPEAGALEGMVHDGTNLYVTNDNYFHGQTGTNQVLVYSQAPAALELRTKFTLFAVFNIDGAPTGSRSVVGVSSCGVTNAGVGLWVIGSSSTGLRVFANTDVGTTERSSVDFTSLPALTSTRAVVVEVDLDAETVKLWVDGTQYGGAESIPNVSGGVSTGLFMLGGAKFGSDELPGVVKAAGLINKHLTPGERLRLDQFLASRL